MRIKYHYSSLRKARVLGLSHEYLFFLRLKATGVEYFKGGAYIKTVSKLLGISQGSVSNNMKRLVRAGFVHEWRYRDGKVCSFTPCSYQKAWRLLGFRPGMRIKRFKFDFLPAAAAQDERSLLSWIQTLEMGNNVLKQVYRRKLKIQRRIDYHQRTTTDKNRSKKEATLAQLRIQIIECSSCALSQGGHQTKESTQNRISCKRMASILGYRTGNTALKIIKKSESMRLLTVKTDRRTVATGVTLSEFLRHHDRRRNQFWKFGNIIENNCNTYSVFPTGSSMPLTARKPL